MGLFKSFKKMLAPIGGAGLVLLLVVEILKTLCLLVLWGARLDLQDKSFLV